MGRRYVRKLHQTGGPPDEHLSASTQWRRKHGMPSRADKAANQQLLTPQEEDALKAYLLRAHRCGYGLRPKDLRHFAQVTAIQRSSIFQLPADDHNVPLPNKNWPQGFYKRHPEIKAKTLKALDSRRDGSNIYEKVEHWFEEIGGLLKDPKILADNVYNMDETGVLLSDPRSVKVLVDRHDLCGTRGVEVKRVLITAVECISAGGHWLPPLIVWPATTHRSNWTTYPTPGWHFACTQSGYTDSEISLHWIRDVFDPLTRARANGKPRILINDGFTTHETVEVLTFCFANNIILCRLPSHTSHKLQPCDVGVFGPLKTAYREQVDLLYRRGATAIGKQDFTRLYSQARDTAFTPRNIRSSWAKAGLFPFNPSKVLCEIQRPLISSLELAKTCTNSKTLPISPAEVLTTPVTSEGLTSLCQTIEQTTHFSDGDDRRRVQKLIHAAKQFVAGRDILFIDNDHIRQQQDEANARKSIKSTVLGKAKVMTWEDLEEMQKKRDQKEADQEERRRKRAGSVMAVAQGNQADVGEQGAWTREVEAMGLQNYCSVLRF